MTTFDPLKEATRLLREAFDDPGDVGQMPPGRDEAIVRIAEALRARGQRRRRMRILRSPLLVAAAFLFVGGGVFAVHRLPRNASHGGSAEPSAPNLGRLVDSTGDVSALRDGRSEPIGRGARLVEGTELRTSDAAEASLDFETGTHVTVGASSRMRLVEQTARKRFALEAGSFYAKVAKLTAEERFVVTTADAEIEVRGTAFRVAIVPPDPTCEGGTPTRLDVDEGVVVLTHHGVQARVGAGERWPSCGVSGGTQSLRGSGSNERAAGASPLPPPTTASTLGVARSGGLVSSAVARADSSSHLAAQNDLFDEAMQRKRAGDDRGAVTELDRLLSEYPSGPLSESAAAERMRLLVASDPSRAPAAAREYLQRHPHGFARTEAEGIAGQAP